MTTAQFVLAIPERDYNDLAYCRRHGWCWFCGEREAERVEAPLIPMCLACRNKREAEE